MRNMQILGVEYYRRFMHEIIEVLLYVDDLVLNKTLGT